MSSLCLSSDIHDGDKGIQTGPHAALMHYSTINKPTAEDYSEPLPSLRYERMMKSRMSQQLLFNEVGPSRLFGRSRQPTSLSFLASRFWFAKNDPSKYRDIYAINDIFEYYQKFVGDYEEVMRGWGYCMPEVTADAIEKHGGIGNRCVRGRGRARVALNACFLFLLLPSF